MENFTPITALIGGGLIGLAAAILFLFNGKIMGVSGIIAQILGQNPFKMLANIVFLFGLIIGVWIYRIGAAENLTIEIDASIPVVLIAGVLVGFGTRLGSGCTSGHGICGIARCSKRSIVATIVFMLTAMLVVYLVKYF